MYQASTNVNITTPQHHCQTSFMSSTTTTTNTKAPLERANQYQHQNNYNNNNNNNINNSNINNSNDIRYLDRAAINSSPENIDNINNNIDNSYSFAPSRLQHNQDGQNGFISPEEIYTVGNHGGQYKLENHLVDLYNNNQNQIQDQHQQQQQEHQLDDSISFALEEIGAILNGKEFDDTIIHNNNNNNNEQQSDNSNSNFEETEASIYETLRQLIASSGDNSINLNHNYYRQAMSSASNNKRQPMGINGNSNNHNLFNNNTFDGRGQAAMSPNELEEASTNGHLVDTSKQPFVEIVEQPSKCALRFRYKCEGRSAGSLPGANSTADNKTFPSIRINNYIGRAVVVISCVTREAPYRAHPHNIVGKEGCKKGICTIVLQQDEPNMVRSFASLGIQCVKRKDIEESLSLRESINVDPFRNGFQHKTNTSNIDLNVVRLCFQVFIEGSTPNKCDIPLVPVVSDPIHDKKAMSDLVITKLSHCSAPATGGREVILLCDRIAKDDIQIRFYEERDGKLIWETYTDLAPTDVHKQVAICFKTPKYFNENITQPVMVRVQLKRISDNQFSEPRLFQFLPCESDEDIISRKRQKIEWVNMNHYALDNILQPNNQAHHHHHNHQHPNQQQQYQHHHHQQQQQPFQAQSQQQQQHSPVMPHNSQPQSQHHQQHHNHQQQHQQLHHQPIQSARSSPSHLNQPAEQQSGATPSPLQHRQTSPIEPTNCNHRQGAANSPPNATNQRLDGMTNQHQPSVSPSGMSTPQAENQLFAETRDLVVRREIIDNDGKVMRLVDRPGPSNWSVLSCNMNQSLAADQAMAAAAAANSNILSFGNNNTNKQQNLASSLDKIDTAELMRDIAFNSNLDLNLCSGLSLHLTNNGAINSGAPVSGHHYYLAQQMHIDQQQQQQQPQHQAPESPARHHKHHPASCSDNNANGQHDC